MMPGDSLIKPLTLTNSGATEFRYAMTTVADNVDTKNLRDQLSLTIRVKTANPCSTEDGAIIYAPAALSGGFFGSPAQGADAGDRSLAAAASETLCFRAELPLSTDNTFMGAVHHGNLHLRRRADRKQPLTGAQPRTPAGRPDLQHAPGRRLLRVRPCKNGAAEIVATGQGPTA